MNDAQSTIVGLKAQDCPGGGWTGQPAAIERATVADCLAHGVCGCIYGDAVQHIEKMSVALATAAVFIEGETIANAVVVPEGQPVHGRHPSLIDTINSALGRL